MENLKIEYISVNDLKPYENNARHHEDFDVNAIADSIEMFGFNDPIGVWSDENIIVEGHGRLMAAKKLGMTEVPIIRLDHMDEEERRAYALVHNKTTELSIWDFGKLEEELADLSLDLDGFGFESNMINSAVESFFDEEEIIEEAKKHFELIVEFNTEVEMEQAMERLRDEGYVIRKK